MEGLSQETNPAALRCHPPMGQCVDSAGDNVLSESGSVVDAVNCAVKVQRELAQRNEALSENRRMEFCMGVNSGDVVEEGGRI